MATYTLVVRQSFPDLGFYIFINRSLAPEIKGLRSFLDENDMRVIPARPKVYTLQEVLFLLEEKANGLFEYLEIMKIDNLEDLPTLLEMQLA